MPAKNRYLAFARTLNGILSISIREELTDVTESRW